MKLNFKRLLFATAAIGILSAATAFAATVNMNLFYDGQSHAYTAQEVKIQIDGKELAPTDMPPVIIEGRTMLPMRLITQELGCEITWNGDLKQAYVINDDYTLVFTVGSNKAFKNGEEFELDVPAMIINDRTMLPVRALAKALDIDITWEDSTRTVYIGQNTSTNTGGSTATPSADKVKLTGITVPSALASSQVFTIEADSAIYSYDEVYLDDTRVVIDVYNSTSSLAETISATNSSIVTSIRTAEHSTEATPYTRIVFDLSSEKEYTITQSADKKQIIITFAHVLVDEIELTRSGSNDRLVIGGDGTLNATVSTLSNPQRIVVDIHNAEASVENILDANGLNYVTAARTGMVTSDTFRVVLEVDQLTDYSYEENDGELKLTIKKSTLENFSFDSVDNIMTLEKIKALDVDDVEKADNYLNGYYELILPGNYESAYGYGTLNIGGDVIESINITTSGNETIIRFNQNRYSEYEIEETDDGYVISVLNPKEVYDKVLLLDAGHGGNDPGTSGNGLTEKNLTLTMALKIADYLEDTDIKVYFTRDSDTRPDNNLRAQIANDIADLMVSVHFNSVEGNTTANGTETLYQVHSNDNESKLTSLKAASILQNSVVEALNSTNRGVKRRTDLLILNGTTVPAVIVEVCFLSNPGDALKISSGSTQDKLAEAMAEAIDEIMSSYRLR